MRFRPIAVTVAAAAVGLAMPAVSAAHGPPKITGGPSGTVQETGATFTFTYDEPAPTQTFECSLDGSAFAACEDATLAEGGKQTYADLAPGSHTFKVRRVSQIPADPLGDVTPAERTWTIAAPAPTPTPGPSPDPGASPTPAPTATPDPGPPPPALDASKPAPCDGVFAFTDPDADGHHPNGDLRGGFFRTASGTLTANLVVKLLEAKVNHDENAKVTWRMLYSTADGARHYVAATVDKPAGNAVAYEYGTVSGAATFTRQGDTQGKLFGGSNGVVQIAIPAAAGASPGATLSKPVALVYETRTLTGAPEWGDRGPGGTDPTDAKETGVGADYVVRECGATAGPPTPGSAAGAPGAPSSGVTSVSLDLSRLRTNYGRVVTLRGRISPRTKGVRVELVDTRGVQVKRTFTRADGRFRFKVRVKAPLELRARAAGIASASLPITVNPRIRLRGRAVAGGIRFTGSWLPSKAGDAFDIEQRSGRQWIGVAEGRVRAKGRVALTVKGLKSGRYRLVPQAS